MGSGSSLLTGLPWGFCLLLQAEHSPLPAGIDVLGKSNTESLIGSLFLHSTIIIYDISGTMLSIILEENPNT